MHLNISVIEFDENLSFLASLSLLINRRNHRKSKWGGGGGDFPLPRHTDQHMAYFGCLLEEEVATLFQSNILNHKDSYP